MITKTSTKSPSGNRYLTFLLNDCFFSTRANFRQKPNDKLANTRTSTIAAYMSAKVAIFLRYKVS